MSRKLGAIQWVAKRTVYSYEDISDMASYKGDIKVILFRLVGHFETPVSFETLQAQEIVKGSIQSITTIPNESVDNILKEANIDDCLISN